MAVLVSLPAVTFAAIKDPINITQQILTKFYFEDVFKG